MRELGIRLTDEEFAVKRNSPMWIANVIMQRKQEQVELIVETWVNRCGYTIDELKEDIKEGYLTLKQHISIEGLDRERRIYRLVSDRGAIKAELHLMLNVWWEDDRKCLSRICKVTVETLKEEVMRNE